MVAVVVVEVVPVVVVVVGVMAMVVAVVEVVPMVAVIIKVVPPTVVEVSAGASNTPNPVKVQLYTVQNSHRRLFSRMFEILSSTRELVELQMSVLGGLLQLFCMR